MSTARGRFCRALGFFLVVLLNAAALAQPAGPSNPSRQQKLQQRFKQFDKNSDGVLQREEIPRLFDQLDGNGDGAVTLEEVQARLGRGRPARQVRPGPAPEELKNLRVALDIPYAQAHDKSHALLQLDIYAPKQGERHPVMIYVHGGGWRTGDKRAVHRKVPFFPDRGYVFVSVNYRLVPQVDVLTEAQDVANAIAWVHDHIEQHGGDPSHLLLMGHSAGAHLVALVATNERFLKRARKPLTVVKGVVPLDTQAYDLVALMSDQPGGVYRAAFGSDPDTWKQLSPIHHVAAGKGIPPLLICFSRGMGLVANPRRKAAAEKFAEALKQAGVRAEVVDASDRNHGQINQWLGRPDDRVTAAVMAFVDSLRKPPSSQRP